jgi:hypothetical protein
MIFDITLLGALRAPLSGVLMSLFMPAIFILAIFSPAALRGFFSGDPSPIVPP